MNNPQGTDMERPHNWHRWKGLTCCKHCGWLKNPKGNKPCPGKVRVALRENRLKEAGE